jgi:hypothetical protein
MLDQLQKYKLFVEAFEQALARKTTSFHAGRYSIRPATGREAKAFKARVCVDNVVIATLEHDDTYRPLPTGRKLLSRNSPTCRYALEALDRVLAAQEGLHTGN